MNALLKVIFIFLLLITSVKADEATDWLGNEIDSILVSFNNIFSTYIKDSEISKINRSKGKIQISNYFLLMLQKPYLLKVKEGNSIQN